MLIELMLKPVFALIGFVFDLLPEFSTGIDFDVSGLIDFLGFAFWIFPLSLFLTIIGNALFWLAVQMVWAIIEFIFKKIPGVN